MIVYIEDEDTNQTMAKIFITQLENTDNYDYLIINTGSDDQEGVIYNYTGTSLELLEKILHGRNVS